MANRFLLDTHVFIWWIIDNPRLPEKVRTIMRSRENELYLSAASSWELIIKAQLGKIQLPEDAESFILNELRQNAIQPLPISIHHTLRAAALSPHHKDPFDRMLVGQALCDNLTILSGDHMLQKYEAQVFWS
ncbi:MAG: PIN domain-containing protein [Chitinivibrionales bacterium]|nr:PIN domain-containing protein [Chitinivibrionales bacterium]